MNRRKFLGSAAAAIAVAAWPDWLRRAFADVAVSPVGGDAATAAALAEALRRAREAGRPALVLVIPEDGGDVYERGHLFGEYLNHATDEQLAPLGRAEVLCAKVADLRAAGVRDGVDGEPLMVAVPPQGRARSLAANVPSWRGDFRNLPRDEDAVVRRRIDLIADLVRRGLADGKSIAAGEVAPLAEEAKRRYRAKPPQGSHWAQGGGCGMTVEDDPSDDEMMVACGMGHVPAKSTRFLYLFAKTPGEQRREQRRKQGAGTTL